MKKWFQSGRMTTSVSVILLLLFAIGAVIGVLCAGSQPKGDEKVTSLVTEENVLDLTALTPAEVQTAVYMLTQEPEKYVGLTVRMNGKCVLAEGEDGAITSCLIKEAEAVCQQGIEFQLTDNKPVAEGKEITVKGTYQDYEEDGKTFYSVADAVLD